MSFVFLHISKASDMSYGLYAKLGFEKVGTVRTVIDGQLVAEYPTILREVADISSR
jgi:hypothetical protein